MKTTKLELIKLLNKKGFYFDMEMIDEGIEDNEIELVQKAYGSSREMITKEVFGKDFKELQKLTSKLKIVVPEYVWFD